MIIRMCLCVPTYNNPKTIRVLIEELLLKTRFPIVVVDDGSDRPVQSLLSDDLLKNARLTVLRHERNQGKGKAIQTAFDFAVQKAFTHLFTLDGDGQHLVGEIEKMIAAVREHPWDVILGNRKMTGEAVPKVSRFGKRFSNFWVNYETRKSVSDSQSGFRIYPLFHVQNLKFWTQHFDFEIEVLIRLMWKGVTIRDVEIDVYYPPPQHRVSHFNKFWDNVRISMLNSILVILSLFKSNHSAGLASLAIGVGVFIGCTPFVGFHTLIAAGLSFLLRLNFIWLCVGTQISFGPMPAILIPAALELGKYLGVGWALGTVIMGAVLGVLVGLISYGILKNAKKRAKSAAWNGRTRGGRLGNGFLKAVTRHLGLKAAYFCLYFIVPYFYFFAPQGRRAMQEYWKIRSPRSNAVIRQLLVLNQFLKFGKILLDRLYQSFHSERCFKIESSGAQHFLNPMQNHQGIIMVGGHLGNWDLASRSLGKHGYEGRFMTVQYQAEGLHFNQIQEQNESSNAKPLPLGKNDRPAQPVLSVRDLLTQGIPVGFLVDRPVGNHFELVPFLGKLAPMDSAPFRIAGICKVPVIFTFGFKQGESTYQFIAESPKELKFETRSSSAKLLEGYQLLVEFSNTVEKHLNRFPDQWFNFFPYWSTVPQPPEGISEGKARHFLLEDLEG